jgi:hypothetical protein
MMTFPLLTIIILCISVRAFAASRKIKTKATKRQLFTEQQIRLYERQMAAREAMGEKYICHPANDVPHKQIIDYLIKQAIESAIMQAPDAFPFPPSQPKLRIVK